MKLHSIDIVDDISQEDFTKKYLIKRKPLVIRNYAKNWPAISKWTLEFLNEHYGEIPVKLNGNWLENDPTSIHIPPVRSTPFSEYLSMMQKNEREDLKIFLFDLFKYAPELHKDYSFTPITKKYLKKFPFLFFGLAGSDVRLHYDIDLSNVFITQFLGTKRITLFDQEQSKYLYRMPFTTHSAVDLRNLDFEKYPALKHVSGYQVDLKHGETLFMPSGIWHYIEYLDSSFSLSLRSLSPSYNRILKGIWNFMVWRRFDAVLHKISNQYWSNYKMNNAFKSSNKFSA